MIAAEPVPEIFDRWALSYSNELNPFLSLDARVIESMLPPLHGKRILDAGCGSGRHFELFVTRGAASIEAVDFSPRMLALAAAAAPACVHLHRAPCEAVPLQSGTVDIAVCSLVVGYLKSPAVFFQEMHRVLREDGCLLLTDMHPDTALRQKWQRSFSSSGTHHAIGWNERSLEAIREAAKAAGFHIACDLTFPFAAPERDLFAGAGRQAAFEQFRHEPALYGLVLRISDTPTSLELTGARCAISAHDAPRSTTLLANACIAGLRAEAHSGKPPSVDLSGYLLLPGLVNAHDHLEFGLFPSLAAGPYKDAAEWAEDIHERFAATIALHRSVPRSTRVRFGALRNLLCGVTTVCHHNALCDSMLDDGFPVNIVETFRWAHSPTFDQAGLRHEAEIDCPQSPFIVHVGEGISEHASWELQTLQHAGLLRPSTIIVHGLAADTTYLDACQANGVGFIVCPSSNDMLFRTVPDQALVDRYPFLTLGSDSPLTARGDLLDEIQFTLKRCRLTGHRLHRLLFANAPGLLRLRNGEGTLAPDAKADLIAVPDRGLSPADTLGGFSWEDVHLVIRRGEVHLFSPELKDRLLPSLLQGFTKLGVDGKSRWIRGDWKHDFAQAKPVAENGSLMLGKRRISLA